MEQGTFSHPVDLSIDATFTMGETPCPLSYTTEAIVLDKMGEQS